MTGEYDLGSSYWTNNTFSRVDQFGAAMKARNSFRHPMSIHPGGTEEPDGSSATHFHGKAWLDHNWLQTYNSPQRIPELVSESLARSPAKPTILSEGQFDAIPGKSAPSDLQRRQAWVSYLSGAAGWVYGAHGVFRFDNMARLSLAGSQDMSRVSKFYGAAGVEARGRAPELSN